VQTTARVRIGELARRTGVSAELLRAWEQRYGLLRPERSAGGFRLYSPSDEARVRRMTALIASGVSASEAAARATGDEPVTQEGAATDEVARELREALDRFDAGGAHQAFDRLLAAVSVESAITEVLVPLLHELGDRWETGTATIGQEHFASDLVRGRMLGIARGWANGAGPTFVLACPPGEEHDLGLMMFGIALARRGARVVFLGADTPVATIAETVRDIEPEGVVIAVARSVPLAASATELAALARDVAVYVGGPGADEEAVRGSGARLLEGDPVAAARALTAAH
jgi:DNA-binding transcriptional MerR regulator/methylmalonyl-CoA mutase cobalamin-binding subunit